MNYSLFRILKSLLLYLCFFASVSFLTACENITPGMHVSSRYIPKESNSEIVPVLKSITPQLVEAERELRDQEPKPDLGDLLAASSFYKIGAGDILSITPWGNPELATAVAGMQIISSGQDNTGASPQITGFVVDHEGMIQFPYIGALKVDGLTLTQARQLLIDKLSMFYKKPEVSMRVQAYRSKRIYVTGEVKTPGIQPINDIPMTLMEAINRAGGFLPTGDQSRIYINRAGTTHQINLPLLLKQGQELSNILLVNGDVVRVHSREESKVFVIGEVTTPRALLMTDGDLTLNQALGEVGGINSVTGSGRQLYVIRNVTSREPTVYHLDATSPFSMALAENFKLKPKDVVYVDTASLALWGRVLSLILPSALSVITTGAAYTAASR